MLRIGDFSRLGRVTIKTLRFWDEIGLLKPDYVNKENGYRYYSAEKLGIVDEIRNLKDLGFYLEDIAQILKEKPTRKRWIELLQSRKDFILDELNLCQKTLSKIDRMIDLVQREQIMSVVEIRELPEVIVASMRTVIPSYDALFKVVPPMGEIMRKQGAVCSVPAYCFNIYHDGEYREKDIDVEICEAVVDFCKDGDGVVYKRMASVPIAAVIMHKGAYESLGASYSAILSWIEDNGYSIDGHPRESYIDGIWNKENSDEWRTEIQIPVKKCKN
ncbi:MAG: MerR family transcriptional regulator [Fibrobacter sp.]|nr:MerR family transcriptional regulator [Fibrobacter sp.]